MHCLSRLLFSILSVLHLPPDHTFLPPVMNVNAHVCLDCNLGMPDDSKPLCVLAESGLLPG